MFSENSKSFENSSTNSTGLLYYSNKNAWDKSDLLSKYLAIILLAWLKTELSIFENFNTIDNPVLYSNLI